MNLFFEQSFPITYSVIGMAIAAFVVLEYKFSIHKRETAKNS